MKASPSETQFKRQMDEGMKLGAAAWERREPLWSCPFGAGFNIPEHADDPRHMGWLFGWWEGEMSRREDAAFILGVETAFCGAAGIPTMFATDREQDHFSRGWLAGLVSQEHHITCFH